MAVKLSPLAGAGWQFFDNLGTPLAGGLLYTYTAGTTTPQATYTSAAGTIANTNPIVLDAAGRTANQTWLTTGGAYKFVLQTSAAVTIGTYDNISGINDLTGALTSLSVVSANGFAGTVANPTSTPAITLSTTVTGLLKGNGTAISAATANTDYQSPITLTTTGTSGAATLISNTLNIPQYSSGGGGSINGQVFTAGGTFTIPAGITSLKVTVVGGGGGSGASNAGVDAFACTGGGGGGGTAISYLTGLTPGNTLTVTIGAGGTAGPSSAGNGGTGGSSTVASGTQTITTITGAGGSGSLGAASTFTAGGAGGSGSNGTINLTGSGGSASFSGAFVMGGSGGSSSIGGGARNVYNNSSGITGGNYGGGASGSAVLNTGGNIGAAGAGGAVIFEW